MVPPEAFSTEAPHSSIAFCSGCVAGPQWDSRKLNVLSCANAGTATAVRAAAIKTARVAITPSLRRGTRRLNFFIHAERAACCPPTVDANSAKREPSVYPLQRCADPKRRSPGRSIPRACARRPHEPGDKRTDSEAAKPTLSNGNLSKEWGGNRYR